MHSFAKLKFDFLAVKAHNAVISTICDHIFFFHIVIHQQADSTCYAMLSHFH